MCIGGWGHFLEYGFGMQRSLGLNSLEVGGGGAEKVVVAAVHVKVEPG